jgi:predicted murein hydrolase (TIGR00659 family)
MTVDALWVYLSTSPLVWLTATLGAYVIADRLSAATARHPLVNPVLIAVAILIALLQVSGTDFQTYFEGAQFVHFMLGPATVALAIPLYENFGAVRANLVPMLGALVCGSLTAIVSAVGIAWMLGADATLLASLAPKSVTTPIAMSVSEQLGGIPAITAVLVITTGVIGAVIVTPLMDALKITDWAARGFAAGVAAHGLGTARAFLVHPKAGAFSGVGMGLNAVLTAVILSFAALWLG